MTIRQITDWLSALPDDTEVYIKGTCDVFVQHVESARASDVDGRTGLVLIPEVEN